LYSRLFSSPECLIQRVQGIPTTVLLPGFSVGAVRLVLEFLAVGEATMATHQWEEVARLLRALEMSTDQVQSRTCSNKDATSHSKVPTAAPETPTAAPETPPATPLKQSESPDSAPVLGLEPSRHLRNYEVLYK
jgi:hypothetical protein